MTNFYLFLNSPTCVIFKWCQNIWSLSKIFEGYHKIHRPKNTLLEEKRDYFIFWSYYCRGIGREVQTLGCITSQLRAERHGCTRVHLDGYLLVISLISPFLYLGLPALGTIPPTVGWLGLPTSINIKTTLPMYAHTAKRIDNASWKHSSQVILDCVKMTKLNTTGWFTSVWGCRSETDSLESLISSGIFEFLKPTDTLSITQSNKPSTHR